MLAEWYLALQALCPYLHALVCECLIQAPCSLMLLSSLPLGDLVQATASVSVYSTKTPHLYLQA